MILLTQTKVSELRLPGKALGALQGGLAWGLGGLQRSQAWGLGGLQRGQAWGLGGLQGGRACMLQFALRKEVRRDSDLEDFVIENTVDQF